MADIMTGDPERIRADIAAQLAELPDVSAADGAAVDLDDLATRLERAHDTLVAALESVAKG
ncbi:hypothetical protein LV457_12530 [Mycobacterium sp. MYCO198283]|uniref:hypothetical protein n=1 Tax=Mycobacterium sp. MYCO198283 TaxID=2883505 RepID=UPI001E46093E|nr:hypothetical protein [Mycobacterium sp. MYCO198283]MCG5433103.1 hypothetical protein [Mycobacterium sp. MYCO198283]